MYKTKKQREAQAEKDALAQEQARKKGDFETLEKQYQEKIAKLEAEIAADKCAVAPKSDYETANQAFRRFENSGGAGVEQYLQEQRQRANEAFSEMVAASRNMSIELIQDDRARGQAQIALEEEQLRKRLNLAGASAEDRKQIEDNLAQWRLLREQQLTEQLKAQWQRDAELWADTTRDMRERYDSFMSGFVDEGRRAFMDWAESGRITTRGLASFIRSEFARLAYERFLSGYVRSAANALFDALLGGGSSGGPTTTGGPDGAINLPDDVPTRGGRARGGSVSAGGAYIVGEQGPEVLVMGPNPGYVVPNHALGQAGQPVVIHQHFTVQSNEDPAVLYRLASMAKEQAMAGVAEARMRGNSLFTGD